ncbi:MAG: Ig-like domain-containing protein [Deltaproteobacteria bacterium]|nr:Ig-like domain-containing protein [Deltaproteobacteria bacterium]
MTRTTAGMFAFCLGVVCLCACDVSVREAGGDAAEDRDASSDSGLPPDAGTSADAGGLCDFVGCDCTVFPCADGLVCSDDDVCTEPLVCLPLDAECADDTECCPPVEPQKGVWCGTEGTCAECSELGNLCTSDFDCCPPINTESVLMCTSRGICRPICEKDTECPAGETCMLSGECFPIPCSADSQCPGEHCCSGVCKTDCGYGPPEACAITTPGGVIFEGRTKRLHAIAWKGDARKGAQMVPWTAFTWSSTDPAVAMVDQHSGEVTGGPAEGKATISARAGAIECGSVVVANHLPVGAGVVRVVVHDAETGAPVEGGDVVIGSNVATKTDASGMAIITSPPADVHVFHDAYTWVSLVGLGLDDYVVYLRPNPDETVAGGYRGKFDFSSEPRGYQFGRACTSSTAHAWDVPLTVAGSWLFYDAGPDMRCDELILTHIQLRTSEGAFTDMDEWLPTAGGFMANPEQMGAENLLPSYRALGRKGFRAAWAIAGGLPSRDVSKLWSMLHTHPDPIRMSFEDVSAGIVGMAMVRYLQNLGHAVQSVFEVVPMPKTATPNADNGEPLVASPTTADYPGFPELDLKPANRLALKTVASLPTLPRLAGKCLGGLYVEGQTVLAGMGAVTLGKNVGIDNPDAPDVEDDCVVNNPYEENPEDVTDGQVALRMSPNHDGLEANPYRLVVLASDFNRASETVDHSPIGIPFNAVIGGAAQPLSGRIVRLGPVVPREVQVPEFLALPEGASFDTASRTIAAPPVAIAGAVAYRFTLANAGDAWQVYTDTNNSTIVLPTPPAGRADRATDARMTVHAFSTRGSTLAELVSSARGAEIDILGEQVDAFSRLTCLKKVPTTDPDYFEKCEPSDPSKTDEACNPACEIK